MNTPMNSPTHLPGRSSTPTQAGGALALAPTLLVALMAPLVAQNAPEITSWRKNLNDALGSSIDAKIHAIVRNIRADVQRVQYNATDVYVSSTTVPSHNVGPFNDRNPSTPTNTNSVYRITRSPRPATNPRATPLGPIGVMANGVPIFNARDARSYFNLGIWNQNAIVAEALGFDAANGHPAPVKGGLYHYHQLPTAVLTQEGETWGRGHSPLIGYAFDGFPIYGPYGFANTNGTGGIRRIRTSYRQRAITTRRTLPDGSNLPQYQWGPVVSARYPLGYYIEDHEFVSGLGDLDEFNGRFTVTPEYPAGIYAYISTLSTAKVPEYPYMVGPNYHGVALNQRRVTIPGGVTTYECLVQRTGAGCGNLSLDAVGQPLVPNPGFGIEITQGPANGCGVYIIAKGLLATPVSLFHCPIYLDLAGPVYVLSITTLNGSGEHTLGLPIPNNSSLKGTSADLQSAACATNGTTTSNALTLLLK